MTETQIEEDTRSYLKASYINPANLGDAVGRGKIANVVRSQYGRPVLVFENGDKLSLNDARLRVVHKAWGTKPRGWLGKEVQYVCGERKSETARQNKPSCSRR
jgi:hypothetical protein